MNSWKQLSCQGLHRGLLVKIKSCDKSSYEFIVSDLEVVWSESLTAEEAHSRCEKFNPRLEAPLASIIEHIMCTVDSHCTDVFSATCYQENEIKIELKNDFSGGIPFRWQFICGKSNQQSQDVFLSPIGRLIMSLQITNDRLFDLIKRKDEEIRDYKEFSGATVSRQYLETEEFDQDRFNDTLRRSKDYQNAINKDIVSILTSPSVNNRMILLESDVANPLPTLQSDSKDQGIRARIKGRTRLRRPRNKRAPAKGVEIESDNDSLSDKEIKDASILRDKPTSTSSKSFLKKKKVDKRKKLF